MPYRLLPVLLTMTTLLLSACVLVEAQTPGSASDLADYRTVESAKTTTIAKTSAPASGTGYLGASTMRDSAGRLVIDDVQPGSPGDKAGLMKGDIVTNIDDHAVTSPLTFREWIQARQPGEEVKIALVRDQKAMELTATLGATSKPMNKNDAGAFGGKGGKGGKGPVVLSLWQKPVLRLAVVRIEFADLKHNDKIDAGDWESALFSKNAHFGKNATGQPVRGSLNDYFLEQSFGKFRLEGKVFDWIGVGKKRDDYSQGLGTNNKTAVLLEALGKLEATGGKDLFKDFDGFIFLYAGERKQTNPGAVYYPHVGAVTHQGTSYRYLFNAEGGPRMTSINSFTKLVGLMLGLPDLSEKKEVISSRGLGAWCALSKPNEEGRPEHFCAWAKEKMGWIQPALLDPTVKQKLILAPIEDSPKECLKVLLRPSGSEYYLLENRRKKGFDTDLPAEGLLIWRVLNDRPVLCESHGVDGPSGPLMHLSSVPYPSEANSAFTPDTTPSSRSPLGGGLPVHITEIRRLGDGKIALSIGYEYR
jgi:M6 family metalloprotease-like protein